MHKGTTAVALLMLATALGRAASDARAGEARVAEAPAEVRAGEARLPLDLRRALEDGFAGSYDEANAGWGRGDKHLDADAVELSLTRAQAGDETARDRARATLDAAMNLIDPASGGVAPSSAAPHWRSPRPKRPLAAQASALRAWAQAFALWGFAQDAQAARGVVRFLDAALTTPDGAFSAGAGARKAIEVRHSGAAIEALIAFADATGDDKLLARARRAALAVLERRAAPGGGFRRGEPPGPAAFDETLAMGKAFLALHGATAEPAWLARAASAAQALEGLAPAPAGKVEGNVRLARFANLLFQWTGDQRHRALSLRGFRAVLDAPPDPAGPPQPALLLAADELSRPPLHVTVVGRPDDPAARALYAAARRYPVRYKRTDLWDRAQGPLANSAVQFPPLRSAAAFLCSQTSCSLPIAKPEDLARAADRLARAAAARGP
ncbi:MAG: hypothetical protein NVSMB23_10890 [Myxococcales bacterium]